MDIRKRLLRVPVPPRNVTGSTSIESNISMEDKKKADHLHSSTDNLTAGDAFVSCGFPVKVLNTISIWLSYCWWHCLDQLIALFIHTTEKDDNGLDRQDPKVFVIVLQGISYLLLLILLLPVVILSFLIWLPLQFLRSRPYSYHVYGDVNGVGSAFRNDRITYERFPDRTDSPSSSNVKTYTVVTGNVCLMPEFLAKLNNVSNTVKRAEKMAQLLCGQVIQSARDGDVDAKCRTNKNSAGCSHSEEKFAKNEVSGSPQHSSSIQSEMSQKRDAVSENFPTDSDFLCLQEVFDRRAANALLRGLHSKYPYIIYDVAWPLQKARIRLLNSGLCIASRFPFLNVDFKAFPDGYREDQLACKGLLMTKINLGKCEAGGCFVGYLATTHLQAITHSKASEVRCKQLKLLRDWLLEFKTSTQKVNDIVMFDIICGDFNFDQESHFEENERKCDFRTIYKDPCLDAFGEQLDWVIGTELKAAFVHDPDINHAMGLLRIAVSELERPRYIASTVPAANHRNHEKPNGKRRIDYILYQNCGNNEMVINDYKFVTGFASLTDHIPIAMSFSTKC